MQVTELSTVSCQKRQNTNCGFLALSEILLPSSMGAGFRADTQMSTGTPEISWATRCGYFPSLYHYLTSSDD